MGRTCLVLAAFLFVASLQVSKSQENQGSDVILCVMQNSDKSALDRWLHCLNMSSDPMEQDEGDLGFQSNEWSNPESLALVDGDEQLVDATDTLLRSECLLKSVIKGKSGSHSIREAAGNTNGVEIARGEDVFFSWLKLNLAIMAVFRLVTSLVRKCCWNESSKPEVDALVDGGSTAVPEVVKPAIEDDISQNSPSAPADLQMLGSSLGSVVGAVFFEVLFKFSSSDEGLSIHSDDICMIMESALEEMSSKVKEDGFCASLICSFLASFKSTYTTTYNIQRAFAYCRSARKISKLKEGSSSVAVKSNCGKSCEQMIQYREAVNPEVEHQVKRTSVVKSMNFLEDNRSFVLMSDYAKSHNEERGDGEVEWPVKRSEPFSVESNDEEMFVDAKSCVEVIHCPGGPIENGCQMKEDISPHNTGACSEQEVLKPIPLFSKCTGTCFEERNLDSLGSSTQDSYQSSDTNRENTRKTYSGCDIDDSLEETLIASTTILTDRISSHLDYIVDDVSSVCDNPDGLVQSNTHLGQAVSNFVCQSHQSGPSDFQKDFLKFYERHVKAQEQRNQFQFVKLQHLLKQQTLEEEKIQLASAANGLMRENIDLNRHKVSFKENIALEQQAKAAHVSFCSMCADELAAGLCIMLTTLVYSVRMYSFSLLNDLVSMCQSSIKEPRRSIGFHMDWFYNSLDSLAGKLQAIVCHFTVTGRILIGSILVGVVAQSLIRRSIMNSSQAMPATILIVVLGGICGFVGKISIDSLGGSGITWWLIWGTFCFLHALTNCFTPSIYRFLHGSHTGRKSRFGLPFWMRRLAFHSLIVLFLPLLAGLLPFGNFSHVTYDLFSTLIESASYASTSFLQWSLLSFWKQ